MKKLFMLFTALWLSLVSSYALAKTPVLTQNNMIKKPNFSKVYLERHCYDIDMAYFNDCQVLKVTIQSVLEVDEKGKVTSVSMTSTGNRSLDSQIRLALRQAQFSPDEHDGVATQRTASFPIALLISASDKEPVNTEKAKLLRQICANNDKCDQNQLEGELAKRNL